STITINPTNPDNVFVAANGQSPIYARYSFDGGTTWSPSNFSGMPSSCCGNQAAFDDFGNLFMVYLSGSPVRAGMSTDGGAGSSPVGTWSGGVDQPSIATGPGSAGAPGSVWISWNQGSMRAAGAPVFGLGDIGAWNTSTGQVATSGTFGGIAIGPNGEVALTYQSGSNIGPATIWGITDYDGLGPNGFSPVVNVTSTNVGLFAPIPAQPQRTIDAEPNLAWDHTKGRLYLVYVDRPSTSSSDTDIYVRQSDDGGQSWTPRIKVNDDDTTNSQFNPAIALDQVTHFIAVTWYDCRNSPGNNTAQIYGTVSTKRGRGWEPNVQIGAGLSSGLAAGSFNFGDYDTMDYAAGRFYRSWGDNTNPSQLTPPNNSTTQMD